MSKLKKLKILTISTIFLVPALLFLAKNYVKAQTSLPLMVAPARQTLSINPGETETTVVKFFNQGTSPISGNIKAVDFIVEDAEGSPILLEEPATPVITGTTQISSRFSAASWIELPYDRASIAPESVLEIQFKIKAPEDARPGGRYVALIFEPTGTLPSPGGAEQEGAVSIAPRIVGLVFIRVNGPITESSIVKRFVVPKFVEYGPISVITELLNRGDYHIRPKGSVTLYNWFGRKVDSQTLDEQNIFPDASRVFESKLGRKLMVGKFKVDFTAAYGETGQVLTAQSFVWVFPWRLALIITLTIAILVLAVILGWKQLKKRQAKLEEKLEEEIEAVEEVKEKLEEVVKPTAKKK